MKKINVLLVGAGEAGCLLAKNIQKGKETSFKLVGFIDDDSKKIGKIIENVEVLGNSSQIGEIVKEKDVHELIIAIPSERGSSIRKIIEQSIGLSLVYKILPRESEVLIQQYDKDYLRYVRRVRPEDLLGGGIDKKQQSGIEKNLQGRKVLITGAAGSIGSELSRQIAAYGASKIVFYDWWENGLHELQQYIEKNYPTQEAEFIIGDVKDRNKLESIFTCFKPDTIFHAAAYKHVPLMELNASEAIKNNIFGTLNVAEMALKYKVEKFVLVSTDKAVNPTNVMGATKRAAEKIIHILSEQESSTIFCSVRFGNVVNSNGSAIPMFESQIEQGGPVTVTHKEVTRFFMTIPEAVHLILRAWLMGKKNDLFVLDMGESIKIYDLARLLIAIHGYSPEKDIKIKIIGLRPGEKLYEEVLVAKEQTESTKIEKIFRTKNYMDFDKTSFLYSLIKLKDSLGMRNLDNTEVRECLEGMISTYKPVINKKNNCSF
jgi:FlaA1/EpsC-like NDP-sugar epimerase